VDDEPMSLEGLKYILNWEKMDLCICGTCRNGKEALEAIDEHNPDVIITDIRMPVMDGLDLIRHTYKLRKKDIKFIVISGYGEFEYAKRAIQYDVRYYLQKPVFEEEIYEIIVEVKEQLDLIRKNKENEEIDKKALLNSLMGHLLLGNNSQEIFQYLISMLGEDILLVDWNCIIIEIEAYGQLDNNDKFKNTKHKVRSVIEEACKNSSNFYILEQDSNTLITLVSFKNKNPNSKMDYIALKVYQSLITVILSGFTIAVGENVLGINNVKHCYTTAMTALSYKFYKGLNCLIFYNEVKESKFTFEFNDFIMSNKVLEAVEELDINKIGKVIDMLFEYFNNNKINPKIVRMFTSNMITKLNNLIYEVDNNSKSFTDKYTICELKIHERTIQELKEFFKDFCLECCNYLKIIHLKDTGGNMAKIEAFIKENYKRNITIRELAENIYLHPTYLGQLFNQKFGKNFNGYIHELRIAEAKRLMKDTNLKNHEIAQSLGYCNYNSFLMQFQKYCGMKPSEFRSGGE
jgi:two-component system response regulator YesN